MTAFDNVRLPEDVERGAQGGPEFFTSILVLGSGKEARVQNWSAQRNVYDISYGIQDVDSLMRVVKFFHARRGRAKGFRFKDWLDYSCTAESVGTGTGSATTFQLYKHYTDDGGSFARKITRVVSGTLVVKVNGTITTVTESLGVITFGSAPAAGATITASFEFDVPVRFDSDRLTVSLASFNAGEITAITIRELKE